MDVPPTRSDVVPLGGSGDKRGEVVTKDGFDHVAQQGRVTLCDAPVVFEMAANELADTYVAKVRSCEKRLQACEAIFGVGEGSLHGDVVPAAR